MKVTVDSLLGSAQKINNKRKIDSNAVKADKNEVKFDSVSIGNKINARVESISREIAKLQTSLTEKQIVRDGLAQLQSGKLDDSSVQEVLQNTRFNNERVLFDFIQGKTDPENLSAKTAELEKLINADINEVRRVQVEVDNFVASNLSQGKFAKLMADTGDLIGASGADVNAISNLTAEKVMRLVK